MDPDDPNAHGQANRLAELVVHLTDCDPRRAQRVIDLTDSDRVSQDDKLAAVARALVRIRHLPPITLDEPLDLREGTDAPATPAALD